MRIPHRMDTEIPQEGPVRGDQERGGRDTADACGPHGRRGDSGGHGLCGPHTHLPEDSAQAQREPRCGQA